MVLEACPVGADLQPAQIGSQLRLQVQLAERVSRDANVVQFYGVTAAGDDACVKLVMELMQVCKRMWRPQTMPGACRVRFSRDSCHWNSGATGSDAPRLCPRASQRTTATENAGPRGCT